MSVIAASNLSLPEDWQDIIFYIGLIVQSYEPLREKNSEIKET